jgi:phospholipase C
MRFLKFSLHRCTGRNRSARDANNFVDSAQTFTDLQNGPFPQVSWVIPSEPIGEHPQTLP